MNFLICTTVILFILLVLGRIHYFFSEEVNVAFIRKLGMGIKHLFHIFVFLLEITMFYLAYTKLEEWAIFCFNYLMN